MAAISSSGATGGVPAGESPAVRVWYCRMHEPADAAALAGWWELLSPDERSRAAEFAFPRDRHLYAAAHGLLRRALSFEVAVAPERWRFRTGPGGRPEITGEAAELDLRFSLSHTPGISLCAVTRGARIGVDVERSERRPSLALVERCFTPDERASLAALPAELRHARFLEHWTLKEAFLKAIGVGLTYPPDRVGFGLASGGPIQIELAPELGEAPGAWQLESWELPGGFRAAVAVESGGVRRTVEVAEMPAPAGGAPSF